MMTRKSFSNYFLLLTALFIACLITSNVIAVKVVNIAGLTLPAGIIIFPISYIINDVLTEIYGYQKARFVIILGFLANIIFVAGVLVAIVLPSAVFWESQNAFITILGVTPRLLMASMAAYLIGSMSNAWVMERMKSWTKGKMLWTRTMSSTIIGEGLDSLIFVTTAFVGRLPPGIIISMVVAQWLFKSAYEAVVTPITYKIVSLYRKLEN